ncbi:hypothetical protein [Phascolarctobacterium sp.]
MAIDEKFIIRLENDISNAVLAFFKENNIYYTRSKRTISNSSTVKSAALAEANTKFNDIIIALQNFLNKLVIEKKRKVQYSKELSEKINTKQLSQDVINKLEAFKRKFENGEEINSHLSRTVFNSKKLDYAFNIWSIKHLHLSESVPFSDKEMKKNRSGQLLFFIENNDTVFFVDVKNHPKGSGFTAFRLLQIIESNNWMSIIEMYPLNIEKAEIPIKNDDDIYMLAKNGVSTVYEVNGKYYSSLGITTSGSKTKYTLSLIYINKKIKILAKKPDIEYLCFKLTLDGRFGLIYCKEKNEIVSYILP